MNRSDEVKKANVNYHTILAKNYNVEQPYFRAENVARIKGIMRKLVGEGRKGRLLDLGCGTGFILDLARDYFDGLIGVDITPAMLAQVDLAAGKTAIVQADTERLPLQETQFDVCSAYSFLHHLYDLRPTLDQAFRRLKPNGLFYADQEPNYYFWQAIHNITDAEELSGFLRREIAAVNESSEAIAAVKDISPEEVALAEFQKVRRSGFKAEEIALLLREIGFRHVEYRYEWFLGQGKLLHEQSAEEAATVETYLRAALPATRGLFKYISFFAQK